MKVDDLRHELDELARALPDAPPMPASAIRSRVARQQRRRRVALAAGTLTVAAIVAAALVVARDDGRTQVTTGTGTPTTTVPERTATNVDVAARRYVVVSVRLANSQERTLETPASLTFNPVGLGYTAPDGLNTISCAWYAIIKGHLITDGSCVRNLIGTMYSDGSPLQLLSQLGPVVASNPVVTVSDSTLTLTSDTAAIRFQRDDGATGDAGWLVHPSPRNEFALPHGWLLSALFSAGGPAAYATGSSPSGDAALTYVANGGSSGVIYAADGTPIPHAVIPTQWCTITDTAALDAATIRYTCGSPEGMVRIGQVMVDPSPQGYRLLELLVPKADEALAIATLDSFH